MAYEVVNEADMILAERKSARLIKKVISNIFIGKVFYLNIKGVKNNLKNIKMEVSQIMRKAMVIEDKITVKEAAMIMSKNDTGSLIIVQDNKIKGIITERDILKNISELGSSVSRIMNKRVVTISPNASVEDAKKIMLSNKIKKIPVVNGKKLVGIITITDVLAHAEGAEEDDFLFN